MPTTSLAKKLAKIAPSLARSAMKAVPRSSASRVPAARRAVGTGTTYNTRLRPVGGAATVASKPRSTYTAPKARTSYASSSSGNRSGYGYRAPSYSRSARSFSRSGGSGGSGGGSGGGAGSPAPPPWNPTGAATRYLESAADMFAKDPTIMLRELATTRFGDAGGQAIYSQLAPTIDNANALYLASMGQDAGQGTNVEWINYLDALIDQQFTPGQFFNSKAAIRNMLDAVAGSPLAGYLGTGDALEQSGNFNKVLGAILDTGYHPLMAQGIDNNVRNLQQAYQVAATKAAVDPFVTYLKAQNPDLLRLLGA